MERYFATYHITSAAHNGRIAGKAEEALEEVGRDGTFRKESLRRWQPIHDAHVVTTFIESYGAIEAAVNEMISQPEGSARNQIQSFNEIYPGDLIREKPTLAKAQLVLKLSKNEAMEAGEQPYQDIELLRKLRNHFVHHRFREPPESLLVGLKSKNIAENPFEARDNFGKFLSYDCATWAFDSCISFLDEFYSRLDAKPGYSSYKDRLRAEIETDWLEREPQW